MGQKPNKSKISPKDKENADAKVTSKDEAIQPKPPPRPPRTKSKTNVTLMGETERSFYLEKYIPKKDRAPPPLTKKQKKKEKKSRHRKRGSDKSEPAEPPPPVVPPPLPPRRQYFLNGNTPEVVFGSNDKKCSVLLPSSSPGIGKKHGWILFADGKRKLIFLCALLINFWYQY